MKFVTADIMKSGVWLTFPPLLFSLSFMGISPTALSPIEFNKNIPTMLINSEIFARIFVFGMPTFFTVGLSTKTQKQGLILYVIGVAFYCLSYGKQNYLPNSAWSNSMIGFTASAYTNLFWMIGLGMLGKEFYFLKRLRYRPIFYIAPAIIFMVLHVTHAIIYYRLRF
jgi:hypothetical protein